MSCLSGEYVVDEVEPYQSQDKVMLVFEASFEMNRMRKSIVRTFKHLDPDCRLTNPSNNQISILHKVNPIYRFRQIETSGIWGRQTRESNFLIENR